MPDGKSYIETVLKRDEASVCHCLSWANFNQLHQQTMYSETAELQTNQSVDEQKHLFHHFSAVLLCLEQNLEAVLSLLLSVLILSLSCNVRVKA